MKNRLALVLMILALSACGTVSACGGSKGVSDVVDVVYDTSNPDVIDPMDGGDDADVGGHSDIVGDDGGSEDATLPFCVLGQGIIGGCRLGQ